MSKNYVESTTCKRYVHCISNDLFDLFSCSVWRTTLPDGAKRFNGILMDRTAIGILRKLPPFHRKKTILELFRRITEKKHIMSTSKYQQFFESSFISAENNDGNIVLRYC